MERHLLSPHQLRVHSEDCYSYPPDVIHIAMLEAESTMDIMVQNAVTDKTESLIELTLFGNAFALVAIIFNYTLAYNF